jgi:hypothetical protein
MRLKRESEQSNKSLQLTPNGAVFKCRRLTVKCEHVASGGGATELYVMRPIGGDSVLMILDTVLYVLASVR